MRTLKLVASNALRNPIPPSSVPKYYVGEVNRCPACAGKAWLVGRTFAQCGNERCGYPLAIVSEQ